MKPFTPTRFEILKNRFKVALMERHSVTAIMRNRELRPSNKEKHIFDFEDGIRLIISRDFYNEIEIIHFSGSVDLGIYGPDKSNLIDLLNLMVNHFCELSGYNINQVKFIQFSEKEKIPHWYVPYSILN